MVNAGRWAFVIGVLLAILSGFLVIPSLALVLVVLGLIVGFMNISSKEVQVYLISVIALLVVGVASLQALNSLGVFARWVDTVLGNFFTFVAASGLVVAIKAVLTMSKED
jgi:hypothetical protein